MASYEPNILKRYQGFLRKYDKDDGIVVNRIQQRQACEKGGSFISEVNRLTVFGETITNQKHVDYKKTLIVKQLPSPEQCQLFRSVTAMTNEEIAYNKIIPSLQNYSTAPLPFADCIHADRYEIVLQDLSEIGFKAVERSNQGLSLQQTEAVLDGLAKLHAASFIFKEKNPTEFNMLTNLTKELLYEGGDSQLLVHQKQAITSAIELFSTFPSSEENQKAIKILNEIRDHSQSTIKDLLQIPRDHSVICHGDTWAGNIMFNEQNTLKLVDLQLMRYNSVATDLCYLLYVNIPADVRAKNMEQLLDRYLQSLHAQLTEKGVNLKDVLTAEWLKKEMETFAIFGVVYGIWIMPIFFNQYKDVEISQERLSDPTKIGKQGGPECEKRIKELILEYVRHLP